MASVYSFKKYLPAEDSQLLKFCCEEYKAKCTFRE